MIIPNWKSLFAGTVLANKNLFARNVPVNKNLFAGTVPANKFLFAGIPTEGSLNIFYLRNNFFGQKNDCLSLSFSVWAVQNSFTYPSCPPFFMFVWTLISLEDSLIKERCLQNIQIFRVEPFIAIKGHVIIVTALNQT